MSDRQSVVTTLARRFLWSKSSDGFVSMITWVSVVGVAIGVLALTVVTSVINGFEGELVRVITGMNGEVILYSRGEPIDDAPKVEARVRSVVPEVRRITASFMTEIMSSGPNGVAGAVIEGVDPSTLGEVTTIPERVVEGRLPEGDDEVALGASLAERLGAKVGGEIRLIAPFVGDPPENEEAATPKSLSVRVTGLVRMGLHDYDSKFVFAQLGAVQKFLEAPGRVTAFKIKLAPGADARSASDRLAESFGYPFRSKDWGQLNKNLFYAIKLEKAVIAIILTVIVIVAAFNVVSTLMMVIHDKTKELSILKAMGLRRGQSFRLFCLIGGVIGSVGTAVGVTLGLAVNWLLGKTHWIELPPEIYYIGYLPVVVKWGEVAIIAGVAVLITFAAALYPAIKVATRSPLEGIRYE